MNVSKILKLKMYVCTKLLLLLLFLTIHSNTLHNKIDHKRKIDNNCIL